MGKRRDAQLPPYFMPLVQEAAYRWGVTPEAILSRGHFREPANARHAIAWALFHGQLSSVRIGGLLDRDHTSVLRGVRRVEADPLALAEAQKLYAWLIGWCRENAGEPVQRKTRAA